MRRREFIAGLGSAAAWPLAARAQQPERMRRIGVLMGGPATETEYQSYLAAFVEELGRLGWNERQNLRVDVRWNASDAGLARIYAAQLIGLTPDVILAATTINLTVIRQATSTVPVVFVQVSDPVAQGFVATMRQPGGNLTVSARTNSRSAANGSACSRKLRLVLRGLRSCLTPTRLPKPNSSCRRSRPWRHPSACRRLPCWFEILPRLNLRWRVLGVSQTAD